MQITYVGDNEAVVSASGVVYPSGIPTEAPDDEAKSLLNRADFIDPAAPKAARPKSVPPAPVELAPDDTETNSDTAPTDGEQESK